jgi:hypothetical protein
MAKCSEQSDGRRCYGSIHRVEYKKGILSDELYFDVKSLSLEKYVI